MKNNYAKNFMKKVEELKQGNLGISVRRLSVGGIIIYILYVEPLTDRTYLSENIIKPILMMPGDRYISIEEIMESTIFIDDVLLDDDESKMIDYILSGRSVIVTSCSDKYIVANSMKVERRTISTPDMGYSLRGSRDSFIESLDANISLIRYRIKDPGLRIDRFTVGRRTKTQVAVMYIDELANAKYLEKIKKSIQSIDVDGIFAAAQVQKLIEDDSSNPFPQSGTTERPDTASASILEGRVIIVVQGSNFVLITPRTFIDFIDSPDDHYNKTYVSVFSTIIRILCITISLTLSSLYVAVVGFHTDILPASYILAIAAGRATVPFNALAEAFGMELTSEILREASIRLPKQIGSAIGIVGTIVIGQAAVTAGLVSPLMVIIVAITTLSSFVAPDYIIMYPIIVLKFALIIISGMFGLFGFIMGYTAILVCMLSLTTVGIPYMSSIAPFNFNDIKNFFLSDIRSERKRPEMLDSRDKTKK